jgi:hypothetical protein
MRNKLTALSIWIQILADEGMRATFCIQSDVSKQCEQVCRHLSWVVFENTKTAVSKNLWVVRIP